MLQFNARHLIADDESNYSKSSASSLFSVRSSESDRNQIIRETVLHRLNLDFDERGERCGVRLLSYDLTRGVGRATKATTVEDSHSKSSSFIDSNNISDKIEELFAEPESAQTQELEISEDAPSISDERVNRHEGTHSEVDDQTYMQKDGMLNLSQSIESSKLEKKQKGKAKSENTFSNSQLEEIELSGSITQEEGDTQKVKQVLSHRESKAQAQMP